MENYSSTQYINETDILKRSIFYAGMNFQLSYEGKWRDFFDDFAVAGNTARH